jgi:secreted trypsin-like serine protease
MRINAPAALAAFALFALTAGIARADYRPFIENGTEVGRAEPLARTVALVQFKGGGHCSSSFLSPRTLLTAGHCAENRKAGDIMIALQNANGSWEQRAAARLVSHPQYSHRVNAAGEHVFRNDVAIVQLAQPFSFAVRTVALSPPGAVMAKGEWQEITDVGYGYVRPNSGGSVLRRGSMVGRVKTIGQFDGRAGLEQYKNDANQNVCPGDSGGPVLLGASDSRKAIAVHSMADGCTDESKLTYSELLWPARAWIQAQIVK